MPAARLNKVIEWAEISAGENAREALFDLHGGDGARSFGGYIDLHPEYAGLMRAAAQDGIESFIEAHPNEKVSEKMFAAALAKIKLDWRELSAEERRRLPPGIALGPCACARCAKDASRGWSR